MTDWLSTQQLHATVTFAEGYSIEGDLHLQPSTALHQGVETPLEMLNRPEDFFAMTLPSGGVTLIAKAQTALVACPSEIPEQDPERLAAAKSVYLQVHLAGGYEVHGSVHLELPHPRSRAMDFLNASHGFFALSDGETNWYVNRDLVRQVFPRD
jgi:hypothetical protein